MAAGTTFTLNTGAKIPALGFGTWQDADAQEEAVTTALNAGYRHIDTARVYGTEKAVGAAIRKSHVPRSEIFLTTKLWNTDHRSVDVGTAIDLSLADLGLDYVDLYLMHWPVAWKPGNDLFPKENGRPVVLGDVDYVDTWRAMEEDVFRVGKAKAIGISNFSKAETERVIKEGSIKPAVLQMELHPWLQQAGFTSWLHSHGIHVTQYSPFGNLNPLYKGADGKLIDDPVIVDIAKKHGKAGPQVALAWGIAKGHSVIPKSKTEKRIKDNLAGDFKLEAADVQRIDRIDRKLRFNESSDAFGYDFFKDLDGK
ncbi:aldo/keto reductase [Candidatus Bathyarchaeota archaeon]|nr:aldo/keto reductase [Candidatus Bathyarchaeota archaeon]